MAIRTLSIKGADAQSVAVEAEKQLLGFSPSLILFFASSGYADTHPAEALGASFPGCRIIGSTSHSEYCGGGFTDGSVSILAADAQSVGDIWVEVVTDLASHPPITEVIDRMHDHFGGADAIFDRFDRYVGLVLFEGSAKSEEYFMDRLGMATDVLFVGGTSSTTENNRSEVYADGRAYENAVVLAALRTVNGYDVIKSQSARLYSDRGLTVTRSDMAGRVLHEFDGRPCGEVYAEVLGISPERVADYFVSNPLGIVDGEEIFIRTFNQVAEDGITLHCAIPEGSEIHLLEIGDIVHDTQKALDTVITYTPAGVVNFNCLYRTFEILGKNQVEPYCALFGRYPSIGFSTSGEAYLGHINETSTILVIK